MCKPHDTLMRPIIALAWHVKNPRSRAWDVKGNAELGFLGGSANDGDIELPRLPTGHVPEFPSRDVTVAPARLAHSCGGKWRSSSASSRRVFRWWVKMSEDGPRTHEEQNILASLARSLISAPHRTLIKSTNFHWLLVCMQ